MPICFGEAPPLARWYFLHFSCQFGFVCWWRVIPLVRWANHHVGKERVMHKLRRHPEHLFFFLTQHKKRHRLETPKMEKKSSHTQRHSQKSNFSELCHCFCCVAWRGPPPTSMRSPTPLYQWAIWPVPHALALFFVCANFVCAKPASPFTLLADCRWPNLVCVGRHISRSSYPFLTTCFFFLQRVG